jgi:acid phosphatase
MSARKSHESSVQKAPDKNSQVVKAKDTSWPAGVARASLKAAHAAGPLARTVALTPSDASSLRAASRTRCDAMRALVLKPNDSKLSASDYKAAARKRLAEEGRTIIANIGDQESDLVGGYAERTFKLPNPFYLVP